LLQTPAVIYLAIDTLVPLRGKIQPGFDEFSAALDHAGIPAVWVTSRSRLQIDDPRRKTAHRHPFIAEGGCGVYLPEGYFHLQLTKTLRLGRFTCMPIAEPFPAASQALEALSSELDVPVVPLRSLSPRELVQNSGLPRQQADLARHRDFDELFFFAGVSDSGLKRFVIAAGERKLQLRQHGMLWSAAVGASLKRCVVELSKLYSRALRSHPKVVGLATPEEAAELFPACNRSVLLRTQEANNLSLDGLKAREFSLADPDVWDRLLDGIVAKV
jgi:predicted mannosyl-3-phosphoglycerate phosphatase (HAD superfamily)